MNADLVIVLTACLVAVAGSLLGVFVVLRGQSMVSDAISHAALPGIVAAYWLSGGTATLPALLGAAATGLLTVVSVDLLTRSGRVRSDAATGVVFPLLFSLGVIWVSVAYRNVHLDLDAVLYGEIAYAPLNTALLLGREIPESLLLMGSLTGLNALFVALAYKELKLSTFDAGLAASLGFWPGALHLALMTLLSVTTVGAFESVGAILVVAFIIVPPACAFLLTRRLGVMLGLALGLGVGASVLGYALALWLDVSIAGMIATLLGLCFLGCLLLSPTQGVLPALARRWRQRGDFSARLLLTALHTLPDASPPDPLALQGRLGWDERRLRAALDAAQARGWIAVTPDGGVQPTGAAPKRAGPPRGAERRDALS